MTRGEGGPVSDGTGPPARPLGQTGPMSDEELLARAKAGDVEAVEALLATVRDRIYRLALRMVAQPADAEDATQEILIKVLTRLAGFRGEAAFTTWAHRIAVNHLLDRRKSAVERLETTFEQYGEDLLTGLAEPPPMAAPEAELLAEEVRLGCTLAMLSCLDREHRVAYILGEIFQVSSEEGASICEVASATYRKRLSRARNRVRSFLVENCGHVNPAGTSCRCPKRIGTAVALGRIDPARPALTSHQAEQATTEIEQLSDVAGLMRAHPAYTAPEAMTARISGLVRSGRFRVLS